jgi:hypothetical protein
VFGVAHIGGAYFTWLVNDPTVVPFGYLAIRSFILSGCSSVCTAVGVSHNPDPVSFVRGIDTARWNNKRPAGVSFSLQCREYFVETEFNVSTNILANDPSRPQLSYKSMHFWPEMSRVFFASLTTCNAERLTGIPSNDDVWNNSICSELVSGELFDITVDWCVWPMVFEDTSAVGFNFAECDCFKSGFFEANAKSSYSTE